MTAEVRSYVVILEYTNGIGRHVTRELEIRAYSAADAIVQARMCRYRDAGERVVSVRPLEKGAF